ncbi:MULTISPECIES: PilW family protein [Moraxella]|uniref:PilW family protein n=1 Tax=Moraxella TaxID=475 RepID=UPI001882B681|nr:MULTISPECIES: PilW family protein [Moraxella]MBE9579126.1 PilW family protein [Moraxella sp. K1664]MBE9588821.1 PilW family protein [Moraxella sp. K1630]MBE9597102.1 PilW family protein [Moraxella sp. K2450]MDH9219119.1 PilW family protein [Moraxella lacunata]
MNKQQGFTLIELMISLVLGLLIIAAASQVYVISLRTATVQQAGSSILDANVFGLQQIENNIRMAGLGLSDVAKAGAADSGILVSGNGAAAISTLRANGANLDPKLISRDDSGPTNTTSVVSDQLTIQYRAPANMRDCEGRLVLGPRTGILDLPGNPVVSIDGQIIVERYFVKDNNGTLELRCDAGLYVSNHIIRDDGQGTPNATILTGVGERHNIHDLGDDGALIVSGIDDFQVRFGIASGANGIRYVTPTEYQTQNPNTAIITVQLGLLTKGSVPSSDAPESQVYTILGNDVGMKSDQGQFIRRVYETNIMLRNSRGRS